MFKSILQVAQKGALEKCRESGWTDITGCTGLHKITSSQGMTQADAQTRVICLTPLLEVEKCTFNIASLFGARQY